MLRIAAAYIRVSSDDQLEYSPDSQLKLIREYAKRGGYLIPEEFVYSDDGISGRSADKRPAFRLMIATAKQSPPAFDTIFVWKYSRFARNQEESLVYKNALRKNGVDVKSISEPSSDSPYASLIERIIEWMDEYYLINLSAEVRRGMKEKASRGECMGTAPYGYRAQDKSFQIRDEEAAIVREIFRRFADGEGVRALASEIGSRGIRTRRGNMPDNRWIRYILGNPCYIGKIRWSTEGRANYARPGADLSHTMIVDGKHPPIVAQEVWEKVQLRLAQRETEPNYIRKENPRMYMLKGLIRCGDCGATLTYVSTASPSLQCHKYAKGQCSVSHNITIAKANAAVIKYLENCVERMDFQFSPQEPQEPRSSADWEKLIHTEEARLRRAKNALLDGAFTTDEYKELKGEIETSIQRFREAQAAEVASATVPTLPSPEDFRSRVLSVLNLCRSDADDYAKNQALRSIIDQIVYHKPDNTLDIFFNPRP